MLAGVAAAAVPGAVLAGECSPRVAGISRKPTVSQLSAESAGEKLVVSGRVVGADCRPLPGALVELWGAQASLNAQATTDADGRFVLTSAVPARGSIHLRISHNGKVILTQRRLSPEPSGEAGTETAEVHRDEAHVWRTTLGLTIA